MKIYTNAVFALNELFLINLYAYFSDNDSVLYIIPDSLKIPETIKSFIQSKDINILTLSDAIKKNKNIFFENLWLHSFGGIEDSKKIIKEFNSNISYYTDYLKNEHSLSFLGEEFKEILFFGYVWNKGLFNKSHKIRICSFKSILEIYKELAVFFKTEGIFDVKSLSYDYYFLRYWGQGIYKLKENIDYTSAIIKYIDEHPKKSEKSVIKGDARISYRKVENVINHLKITEKECRGIEEIFASNFDSEYVNSLPAEVFFTSPIKGTVHTFDSTLCIYMALLGSKNIVFPERIYLEEIFETDSAINTVLVYSDLYKLVTSQIFTDLNAYLGEFTFIVEPSKSYGERFQIAKKIPIPKEACSLNEILST